MRALLERTRRALLTRHRGSTPFGAVGALLECPVVPAPREWDGTIGAIRRTRRIPIICTRPHHRTPGRRFAGLRWPEDRSGPSRAGSDRDRKEASSMVARRAMAARLVSLLVASVLLAGCGASASPVPSAGTAASTGPGASAGSAASASPAGSSGPEGRGDPASGRPGGDRPDRVAGHVRRSRRGRGDRRRAWLRHHHRPVRDRRHQRPWCDGAALLKVWIGGDQTKKTTMPRLSACRSAPTWPSSTSRVTASRTGPGTRLRRRSARTSTSPATRSASREYALSRGIVAKADAPGDTTWASVSRWSMTRRAANPGNSGGPVVTPEGQIVAVQFAGNRRASRSPWA